MPNTCKCVTALPPAFWPINEARNSPWINCPPGAVRIHAVVIPRQTAAVNPTYEASVALFGTRDDGQTVFKLSDPSKGTGYPDAQAPRAPDGDRGIVEPDVKKLWELEWIDDRTNPQGEGVPPWGDGVACGPQIVDTTNLRVRVTATCHSGFVGDAWFAVVLIALDAQDNSLEWDVQSWRQ